MSTHIHVHVGTRDAATREQITAAKRDAANAIKAADAKVVALKNLCTDRDDKSQCGSAHSMLNDALGKIELEVLSG